jgi:heme-degrading monooxygenase HmoA
MVLEVADITVTEGSEQAFVDAYHSVRDVLVGTEGCHGATMHRGVESPSLFVLLVRWDSVEAHEQNFRGSERFATWRGAIGQYFAKPPYVEHVAEV